MAHAFTEAVEHFGAGLCHTFVFEGNECKLLHRAVISGLSACEVGVEIIISEEDFGVGGMVRRKGEKMNGPLNVWLDNDAHRVRLVDAELRLEVPPLRRFEVQGVHVFNVVG